MSRTKAQIIADYQALHREIDPSTTVHYGPVFDTIIQPNASIVSTVEVRQDRTDRLASADFTAVASSEELERMAATVGAGQSQGQAATGYIYAGTRSQPRSGVTIRIPKGTLVSSDDGALIYQTTEDAVIDGNFPGTYRNAPNRTYEVRIPIVAIAVGTQYNLPPYRVRRLVRAITGVDFVENRQAIEDGLGAGTDDDLRSRAETRLTGQETATPNGIAAAILESYPAALSISVITSADYTLFRRPLSVPGLDYYYAGTSEVEVTDVYTAVGGELTLTLDHQPVLSVTSVLVDGVSVDYTLIEDDAPATRGSTRSETHLLFSSALSAGAGVTVRYKYDSLAESISEDFTGDGLGFFGTDILVRRSLRVNPRIELSAKASSDFNPHSLKTAMEEAIVAFFETNEHGATYSPETFKEALKGVVGLVPKSIVLTLFQLDTRALTDVEPIELRDNEIAEVDLDLLELNVR